MIAPTIFAKRCFFIAAFVLLTASLLTTSLSNAAEESTLTLVTSDHIPILQPVEAAKATAVDSSATAPVLKSVDAEPAVSTIRVIIPTSASAPKGVRERQAKVATPQEKSPADNVHRAEPIGLVASGSKVIHPGSNSVVADQPLRTIQFLNALSANWDNNPKTPSPFKDEPAIPPAPKPVQPTIEPKTIQPHAKPKPLPAPKRQRAPAPIESKEHTLAPPEPEEPSRPSASLNDDLPYYQYDKSCGTAEVQPFRASREQLKNRIFRGRAFQQAIQQGSCSDGQCPPSGDPWGSGYWVDPGFWVPTGPVPGAVPLNGGPVCHPETPCNDGVYGWGPPRRLFQPLFLESRGITLGGWIDQGITYNALDPADRYNGPVTFNDRSGDYQMNQLDVFLERKVDGSDHGLDIGGRLDVLFGTDARFTEAVGWETNWDMNERFYRLSVPQMYADFGWRDWTVRMGHFYSTIGYESVPAVNNFFYSHSYSMQYGEPFTFTGMLAFRRINSQLKVNLGFDRGWDQFNGIDDCNRLSVLTGANWVSKNGKWKFDFALTAGPQAPDNSTVMYSMVGTYLPRGWLECVIQHDYGQSTGGNLYRVRFAEWYSLSQYVFVTLNEKWKAGARLECFCDKQGVRVHGLGQGNLAAGPYPGDFWEMTLGLNWEPRRNIRIRPEARWDWYSATGATVNKPFDGGNSNNQFLLAVDAIVQF